MSQQHVEPGEDVGAFGLVEDVDWENTSFATEDSGPRPNHPGAPAPTAPAPTGPAPAEPVAQIPVVPAATPAAPAPAPSVPAQPSLPVQQPVQQPVEPAAPAPAASVPAPAPAEPVRQIPVAPAAVPGAPAHVVEQPYQPPAQPVPLTRAQPAPNGAAYSTTPGSGYGPATSVRIEDLSEPDWAHITPTGRPANETAEDEAVDPVFDAQPFEGPLYPTPAAAPVEPVRSKRTKRSRTATDRPARAAKARAPREKKQVSKVDAKRSAYAGNRWARTTLRVLIYAVLGLLLLGGLKNVVSPHAAPSTEALANKVANRLGINGYPTQAAEAFATRFAREYLTYSPATFDARAARLAAYSPAATSGDWGWTGTGRQTVTAGPYVSAPTRVDDKHFGTVTVTAQVDSGAWESLAVPVYADGNGALVVSGPPAFVAQPKLATNPGKDLVPNPDDNAAAALHPVLTGFFTQWAASDRAALARYLTPDATTSASTGLGGTVTLAKDGVTDIVMPTPSGPDKSATGVVTVTWQTPTAGQYIQSYLVTVVKSATGEWSVRDVEGGAPSSTVDAAGSGN